MPITTVVGVPHPAATRDDLVAAITARRDGPDPALMVAGVAVLDLGDPTRPLVLELEGPNPAMAPAFAAVGRGAFSDADLDRIAAHGSCAYVVAQDGGTIGAATTVVRIVRGLLLGGGLGAKVESAGIATTAERWLSFGRDPGAGDLVEAFVAVVHGDDGWVRTCGMHNLGLPDARTPADDGAAGLVQTFVMSLAIDQPTLADGETFGLAADRPGYRLALGADEAAPPDDIFHNPFGVWSLDPL